jgi:magnesium transporter
VIVRALVDGRATAVDDGDLDAALDRPGTVVWADLDHTDDAGMTLLADRFRYRAQSLDECRNRTPVPKFQVHSDHVFLGVNGLVRGDDGALHFQPLKFFLDPARLVTVLGPTHPSVDVAACRREAEEVRSRLDEGRVDPATTDALAHGVFMGVVRAHEALVDDLARRITSLERDVIVCDPVKTQSMIEQLFTLRHELQTIRTNAAQNREICSRLTELRGLPPESLAYAQDLLQSFEHLRQVTDLEREYLQELLDLLQTRIAQELNLFVRQLTAWGAIGIAGTLIAGIYGMNFVHMPELAWQYGYPLALGLMVVAGLLLAYMFRRRGWL